MQALHFDMRHTQAVAAMAGFSAPLEFCMSLRPLPNALNRRKWLQSSALLLGSSGMAAGMSACGGGGSSSSGNAMLRLLNLSTDLGALDLYTGSSTGDTARHSGVAAAALSPYVELGAATYTLKLRRAGSSTDLLTGDRTLAKNEAYTAVVWGRESQLTLVTLSESEKLSELDSGKTLVRVYNASADLGSLNVYLTSATADLDASSPSHASLGAGQLSGYVSLGTGSYRLRITGAADSQDLRLDIPSLALGEKQALTVILTAGSGGVLAHAHLVPQQGELTAVRNAQARLRVVASAPGLGTAAVSWGGQSVVAALGSPSLSAYTLLPAGNQALQVRMGGSGGVLIDEAPRTLEPGADYTLLVWGSGKASLIADDNRLPSTSTRAKLRLMNGGSDTQSLTLTLDYAVLADGVAAGQASSFGSLTPASTMRLDLSDAASGNPVYTLEEAKMVNGGVYTLFALRSASGSTALLRKDR